MSTLKLSEKTVNEIKKELTTTFQDVYEKWYPQKNEDFNTYLQSFIDQMMLSLHGIVEVTSDMIKAIANGRHKIKKRWVEKALSDPQSSFFTEIQVLSPGLFERNAEVFQSVFGCNTPAELEPLIRAELETWLKDTKTPIVTFRYIKDKNDMSKSKAFFNDMKYQLFSLIKKISPTGDNDGIIEMPNSMTQFPFSITGREVFDQTKIVKRKLPTSDENEYFIITHYIDSDTYLENLLDVEILKSGIINNALKTLNVVDLRVFRYVLSLRGEDFFSKGEIQVNIGNVVRHVFEADSARNYQAVRESLIKMKYISPVLISKKTSHYLSIFSEVWFYNSTDNGTQMATIDVSKSLIKEYIKNQIIRFYRRNLDQLQSDTSKILIFALQRERINLSMHAKREEPIVFRTNIDFFRRILLFSDKKRSRTIKVIEQSLSEIVSQHVVIKNHYREADLFVLEFYPISEQERIDLLPEQQEELQGDLLPDTL